MSAVPDDLSAVGDAPGAGQHRRSAEAEEQAEEPDEVGAIVQAKPDDPGDAAD